MEQNQQKWIDSHQSIGEVEDRSSVKSSKVIRYMHRQSQIRLPWSTRKHQMPKKSFDINYESTQRENLGTLITWNKQKPFEQQSLINEGNPILNKEPKFKKENIPKLYNKKYRD